MEAAVTKNEHLAVVLLDQRLEGGIIDIGRVHCPIHNLPQVIENEAQLGADDPAVVGLAFPANLLWTAAFTPRMN